MDKFTKGRRVMWLEGIHMNVSAFGVVLRCVNDTVHVRPDRINPDWERWHNDLPPEDRPERVVLLSIGIVKLAKS